MTDVIAGMGEVLIGRQGENLVTRVVLPNLREGAGGIVLLHQRSRDKKPYPVTVTEDAGHVYWMVSSADTAYDGRGLAELQWLGENGEVLKSRIWQTRCLRSLEKPEPQEPWNDYIGSIAIAMAALRNDIGDLGNLDTEAKSNLVAAINEALTKGGGAAEISDDEVLAALIGTDTLPALTDGGKIMTLNQKILLL